MTETIGSDGRLKDRMGIAAQGVVFSVYLSTQPGAATGWRKVLHNSKNFDPFGWFDTVTNNRFTPKIAGYYRITTSQYFNLSAGEISVSVWKNGSMVSQYSDLATSPGSAGNVLNGSTLVYLNGSTDYAEAYAYTGASAQILSGQAVSYMTGELVGASQGVIPEPWHVIGSAGEPAFQNSWANFGLGHATAAFFKDPHGIVHLRGMLAAPASPATTAFTLPAGYRPGFIELMDLISNNAQGRCQISPDGTVTFQSPTTASQYVSINSVTFRAEA